MERIVIIHENTNRAKAIQDFLDDVNPRLADGWETAGPVVEYIAPRKGGYAYAWLVEMERKPEFVPG